MAVSSVSTWSDEVLKGFEGLLERSLAAAGEVQRTFYGKPERRLTAAAFLSTWNSIYMCAATTCGPSMWPHVAGIKLEFDAEANLPMLVYLGGARERDLRANPRVALQKHRDDGVVMVVYGRARWLPGEPSIDKRERRHAQVLVTPVRAFGMGPYVEGPLAARAPGA
ncbi:MAG TPA: hypothetical protein VFC19_31990 [Candidatus Limnocylindrales bacterium]|nr:hypothetical protein [Candidatus Limnocylindrales bacterium]